MKCPDDGNLLNKRIYESVIEIDECPECQGIWLDAGELERIQETIENDYSDELKKIPEYIAGAYNMAMAREEGERECQNCNRPMEKREYGFCSQITIDVCPYCRGIWLDKGEIQGLEVFFERSKAETNEIRRGFFGSLVGVFNRDRKSGE